MGKTTIDGMAVRSSKKRPVVSSSTHIRPVDMTTRSSSVRAVVEAKQKEVRTLAAKVADPSEFLNPVESFGAQEEKESKHYSMKAGAGWSDLLTSAQSEMPMLPEPKRIASSVQEDFVAPTEGWDDEFDSDNDMDEDELGLGFDEEIEKPKRRKSQKKYRRHRRMPIGRVVAVVVVCLLLVMGGALYFWGDGLISKLTNGKSGLWDTLSAMVSDEVPFETDANGRTNVLVFGTGGYNMEGETANGQHGGAQLTDSIMVISIDQKTKDVALLSLPRDLKVTAACSAGKVNEVYWCNNKSGTDEEGGARAMMEAIGEILDVDFQYYAHVNWASLIDVINAIGGITITLDEDINDYGWTGAVAKAGEPMEVNGEQALGLARARHGTSGGDFTRGNTQQKIVEGIVAKVTEKGLGINDVFNILNILGDNLRSNFSADNIKAGMRLAAGFNASTIRQVPLIDYQNGISYMTTATINEISYVIPVAGQNNYQDIQDYVKQMFSSDAKTREGAKTAVYNATSGYGVAGAEKKRLVESGFIVNTVGDANVGTCKQKYCLFALSDDKPETQKALEAFYGMPALTAEALPEGVASGDLDFIILVGEQES